jgi:hypothetical protein
MVRILLGFMLFFACVVRAASAAPGDSYASESARLARDAGLASPSALDGTTRQWLMHDRAQDPQHPGDFSWTFIYTLVDGRVDRETLSLRTLDRPYTIRRDVGSLVTRLWGRDVRADFDAATLVARQSDDPEIRTAFFRGRRFAYRAVDDERDKLHTLVVMQANALAEEIRVYNATLVAPPVAPAASRLGDALFAVSAIGGLEPIAIRNGGRFLTFTAYDDGTPDSLVVRARDAIVRAGGNVHLIFGRQILATLPVTNDGASGAIILPPTVTLGGPVTALASPTLGGGAAANRAAPSAADRAAAIALAAGALHTRPEQIAVDTIATLDLGRGLAVVATVADAAGNRLFFIAERRDGKLALTLSVPRGEVLVDAVDPRDGGVLVVSEVATDDAHAFVMYARAGAGWKRIFTTGTRQN